jgi:mitotic spindle assembly checkpoint protein MAD2B
MPQTLDVQLGFFADFLLAYTHTLLCLRALYPRTSFVRVRFHNTPVYQSRHPAVCQWIRDAIAAVHSELLSGTVARIGIVIYWQGRLERSGSPKILERYMLDVSSFPALGKEDRNMHVEWDNASLSGSEVDDSSEENDSARSHAKNWDKNTEPIRGDREKTSTKTKAQSQVDVDMSEQFRAALVMLNTRCSRLKPLPKDCSFNLCMELKDQPGVDPPLGHAQPWIPAQSTSQSIDSGDRRESAGEERLKGLAKTTPIRTVEAGVLRFDTWLEESKAKSDLDELPKGSSSSPGS